MIMFLHVEHCEYVKEYILRVSFNNGDTVEVDLKDELNGPIFKPLQSIEYFRLFKKSSDTNTVEWPNGADFAPEFLLEKGKALA
jgi:hypothetical protein